MIVFPNAKINLGLNITAKRTDGFHDISSVFVGVNWCDALEFIPAEKTSFTSAGIEIILNDDSNLVLQAYNLLKKDFNLSPLKIHLEKVIPIGAGLGGGSADASFMLTALNNHFKLNLSDEKLEEYALALGSDCPFFISNKIVEVHGRGEILTPLKNINLSEYQILLINPNIHISTKEAYAGITPKQSNISFEKVLSQPIQNWKKLGLKNDFEDALFTKYPQIITLKEELYNNGALYASMSGSGSTVFGIFKQIPDQISIDPSYQFHKGQFI